MPGRENPLVNNGIYHVFNRGITNLVTFENTRDYFRVFETISFYRHVKPPISYSSFTKHTPARRKEILTIQSLSPAWVSILSYCIMPNHFHLLLEQLVDGGISSFISLFTNSYTRYFNTQRHRAGPVFQGKFKAVRIESEEQLLHISRYIHLNPYSSGVITNFKDIENYPFSSLKEYLHPQSPGISNPENILNIIGGETKYREFVLDHADYQRQLELIKHQLIDL